MDALKSATLRTPPQTSVTEGAVELIERQRRWAQLLCVRSQGLPSFSQVARGLLVQAVRVHCPQGNVDEGFIEELLLVQVRRLLSGTPLGTKLLEAEGEQDEDSLYPALSNERWRTVVEVTEAVAPELPDLWKAVIRVHLLAPTDEVPHASQLLNLIETALGAWEAELDALFTRQPLLNAHEALEALATAHDTLVDSLTLSSLLPLEDSERLGDAVARNLPHWLRFASAEDKLQLERLAQRLCELEAGLAMLDHDQDRLAWSTQAIAGRLSAYYGGAVDPEQIKVQTVYSTPYGQETVIATLAQVLFNGPYAPDDAIQRSVVKLPETLGPEALAVDLSPLFEVCDPRVEYNETLRTHYQSEDRRLLAYDHADAALTHSALAALMQGHLDEASYQAVVAVRDLAQDEGSGQSVRELELPGLGGLGVLVFENPDEAAAKPLVLYAPDKFDGQEWIALPSIRALNLELGAWAKEETGRLYLLDRLPLRQREAAEAYLASVILKPIVWDANRDLRTNTLSYRHAIERLVELHHANKLDKLVLQSAPLWYIEQPLRVRQALNSLNERLTLLRGIVEHSGANPEPFVRFAKRTVTQAVAPYFTDCGVTASVDPETVLFKFTPGAVFEFGFGEAAKAQSPCLMDLAVTGYDDNWGLDNPQMPVYSSIGQDLGQARAADLARYLRSAYLGDKYEAWIRAEFLEATQWRRQLYAWRAAMLLERDALAARLKGQLDEAQHAAIAAALPALQRPEGAPGLLRRVTLRGWGIAGVYLLNLPGTEGADALVYCPEAPDGVAFRPYRAAFGAGLPTEVQLYYLQRVPLATQKAARTRLGDILWGSATADVPGTGEPVVGFQVEYDHQVECMLADVDHITKSRREVIFEQVLKGVELAAGPLGVIFPPLGFVLDTVFIAISVSRGYQAYRLEDTEEAIGFFSMAFVGTTFLLGPVGWHWGTLIRKSHKVRLPTQDYAGVYQGAPARWPVRPHSSRYAVSGLDPRWAVRTPPSGLAEVADQGLTQGLYRAAAGETQPRPQYFIKQGERYFEAVVDADAGVIRVVDSRHPLNHYKMPVELTPEGRWVYKAGTGLPGGRVAEPLHLGVIADVSELFPAQVPFKPDRVALAGEAIGAGFDPVRADNYLLGLETRGSVVASLYNPVTRRGALLNIDHGIAAPIDETINQALASLGAVSAARPVQGTLMGGDWLALPGDILSKVTHVLGLNAVLAKPVRWLWGMEAGGTGGLLLDLKDGGSLVYRLGNQSRAAFYDTYRELLIVGQEPLRQRTERFWSRLREGRWQELEDGSYANARQTVAAQEGREAARIVLELLDG